MFRALLPHPRTPSLLQALKIHPLVCSPFNADFDGPEPQPKYSEHGYDMCTAVQKQIEYGLYKEHIMVLSKVLFYLLQDGCRDMCRLTKKHQGCCGSPTFACSKISDKHRGHLTSRSICLVILRALGLPSRVEARKLECDRPLIPKQKKHGQLA